MTTKTSIEWATHSWNPVRGCSRVSPGCQNCYAERTAALRLSYGPRRGSGKPAGPYHGLASVTPQGPRWTGKVVLVPGALGEPRHWSPKKPRRVFVNSMSDLFHEGLPFHVVDRVFLAMMAAPAHTFLVLTKRAERMRDFMNRGHARIEDVPTTGLAVGGVSVPWPPPNVWIGVSVESEPYARTRLPVLCGTAGAVKFVSVEPMLGPVDLSPWIRRYVPIGGVAVKRRALDWIIVGGESGPAARPCDLAWIRSVVRQCRETETPVFVKQLGARAHVPREILAREGAAAIECPHGFDACPKCDAGTAPVRNRKGGDPAEWPADLRVRELPKGGAL